MRPSRRLLLAASLLTLPALTSQAIAQQTWLTHTSPHSVADTKDKLVAAIENAGATLFAVIDHEANGKQAGLAMNPATLVIFGNPKAGTPIMNADPKAAIDLPIRVLVWEEDGKTMIGALSAESFKKRYDVDGAAGALDKMVGALKNLMGAATK